MPGWEQDGSMVAISAPPIRPIAVGLAERLAMSSSDVEKEFSSVGGSFWIPRSAQMKLFSSWPPFACSATSSRREWRVPAILFCTRESLSRKAFDRGWCLASIVMEKVRALGRRSFYADTNPATHRHREGLEPRHITSTDIFKPFHSAGAKLYKPCFCQTGDN